MGDRLNQYQRRQRKRRDDAIMSGAMVKTGAVTLLASPIVLILTHGNLTTACVPMGIVFAAALIPIYFIGLSRASKQHNDFVFDEEADQQAGRVNQAMQQRRPRNLAHISPREFEEEVARLITLRSGCRAEVVGGAGDHGVDIKVYNRQGQLVGVVQCKRYKPGKALPPMFVREMYAVKQTHAVQIAYIATTTYFTNESKREAERLGIRLISGNDLKLIAKKTTAPQKPVRAPTASTRQMPAAPPPAPLQPPQHRLPVSSPQPAPQPPQIARPRFTPSAPLSNQSLIEQQLQERREQLRRAGKL